MGGEETKCDSVGYSKLFNCSDIASGKMKKTEAGHFFRSKLTFFLSLQLDVAFVFCFFP